MDDSVFRWTAVEGRYSLNGASYVLSIKLDWQSIRSAIIYDDELAVTFTDPLGHLQWLVMPLVRTYDDVGNIELRGQDDSSDTGWRYVPFEFARGVPDLTPVKVKGSTGDDVLYDGLGADVVKGGKGNDILHGERVSDNHWIGGDDVLYGGAVDDTVYGYRGDDVLKGGKGNDTLYGGFGDDRLSGNGGDDVLYGGTGDDSLNGGSGDDVLYGGAGSDTLNGGRGNDILYGSAESFPSGFLPHTAFDGDDVLYGGAGDDKLYGGHLSDLLDGGSGDDVLVGGAGDDIMTGGKGRDVFHMQSLADDGQAYDQVTDFELGIDTVAHIPDEAVICHALKSGTDDIVSHVHIYQIVDHKRVYLELTVEDIALDDFTALVDEAGSLKNLLINGLPEPEKNTYPDGAIIGTEWDDPLLGGPDDDVLYGGAGDDHIHGETGDDVIYGGKGNDTIQDGFGDDRLIGGKGDDFLGGDLGNDVMTGGKGADIFYFSSRWAVETLSDDELPADNHDRVTDFEVGTDKIGIHTGDGSRLGVRLITRDVDETETVKGLKVTLDEANSIKVNFETALSVEAWDSLVDGAGGLNELVFTEVWA